MSNQVKTRRTRAKQLIIHIFQNTPEPISLKELYEYVKISLPNTAYSTVFRTVLRLVEDKQLKQVDWRERSSRYEWSERPHHHHIVCQICGRVVDVDDNILNYDDKKIQAQTGFLTKHHSIELEGICPECRKKIKGKPVSPAIAQRDRCV